MKKTMYLIGKSFEILAAIFLIIFCVVSFTQVVVRMANYSFVWTEEVSKISFIYMVFTGCTAAMWRGSHYSFDFLSKSKNKYISTFVQLCILVFEVLFFLFLLYTSIIFIPQMHARASAILQVPMSYSYFAIPLFAGASLLFCIVQLISMVFCRGKKEDDTKAEKGDDML